MQDNPTQLSSEKKRIERATAQEFLEVYNKMYGTHFEITAQNEHPDVECTDSQTGKRLYLEITLLEDWEGDIRYLLGRGQKPDTSPVTGLPAISLNQETLAKLNQRLKDKLLAQYGPDTALVIRQVSPIWSTDDWRSCTEEMISEVFQGREKNYEAGVWILSRHPNYWPYKDDILELTALPSSKPTSRNIQHSSGEHIVGKVTYERFASEDFTSFAAREDVDPVYRIESPHGCQEAVLIAFVRDEPEEERQRAVAFYRDQMVYHCICGMGKFCYG